MKRSYYFKEQGVEGFTSIIDKKRLSEALYYSYKLFMIKEASNNIDDFFKKNKLIENDENLENLENFENKFCIGSWLYGDGNLFIKRCSLKTHPKNWPRHVTILEENKDTIGIPITDNNRLEINRAFKRGFNYFDDDHDVYVVMAGESFTHENLKEILDSFNVPENKDYIVRKTSALDPAEIDPKYFIG